MRASGALRDLRSLWFIASAYLIDLNCSGTALREHWSVVERLGRAEVEVIGCVG